MTDLVTVIVIVGIMAAFTAPRFFDQSAFQEFGFYEEVTAALRYGQKISVGSGCPVQVSIDGCSRCTLDNTTDGRGKGIWTCDNGPTAASFFLIYNPGGKAGHTPTDRTLQVGCIGRYISNTSCQQCQSARRNTVS